MILLVIFNFFAAQILIKVRGPIFQTEAVDKESMDNKPREVGKVNQKSANDMKNPINKARYSQEDI